MNESIGHQLRQVREAQKLTLAQVASATHMRERYLQALEDGRPELIPSLAQARGFLRAYASYLKLDPAPLLQELDNQATLEPAIPPEEIKAPRPAVTIPFNYSDVDRVFIELGLALRRQREMLGLSLDDVVRYTHLRKHYLQALESGQLDDLPSPVQGRGMLENYAVFMGMDPEPLLLHFAEGLQARLNLRQVRRQETPETAPPRRRRPLPASLQRLLSPDLLIGVSFAIFLIVFMVWGAIRIFAINTTQLPEPTAPSIAEVLLATSTPQPPAELPLTPTAPSEPQPVILPDSSGADATAVPFQPVDGAPGVQVYVTVTQRAFLRAIVDGKLEFEGRVIPGSAYPFVGQSQVELLTSNGAGIQVFYNQGNLGPLGVFGEVVSRTFTVEGILLPTPTVTRTPAAPPPATPTADLSNLPAGTASP
jgi:cytoskeletal protein RodZ